MVPREVVVEPGSLGKPGDVVIVAGPEARHLVRVLRMGPGSRARLKDGCGRAFSATVISAGVSEVRFELHEETECGDDTLPLILMPAIIKGKRMDWLIQKACELGVRCIQPVITERTVSNPARDGSRARRWREIAVQALKQCRGNILTRVNAPMPLETLLDNPPGLRKIMLFEGEEGHFLLEELTETGSGVEIGIISGPEGGFSPGETGMCLQAGFRPVSLGSRILRAETASICAAAQVAAVHAIHCSGPGREGMFNDAGKGP